PSGDQCPPVQGPFYKLSFQRPNPYATPEIVDQFNNCKPPLPRYATGHLAAGEVRVLRWLNRNNHSYSMLTDSDLDAGWNDTTRASALDPFAVVIISTHSEYWSDKMYKSLSNHLARGGNVVSLSGNTIYWRVALDQQNAKIEKLNNPPTQCSKGL